MVKKACEECRPTSFKLKRSEISKNILDVGLFAELITAGKNWVSTIYAYRITKLNFKRISRTSIVRDNINFCKNCLGINILVLIL